MNNHQNSSSTLRQLEITFNQVNRSLHRALRAAETAPLPTSASLEAVASSTEGDPASFGALAQAAGPAWQAVQLRCALLRDVVEFTERVSAILAPAPASASAESEPLPDPMASPHHVEMEEEEGTRLDQTQDPYELASVPGQSHKPESPAPDNPAFVRQQLLTQLTARAGQETVPAPPLLNAGVGRARSAAK